MTTTAGGMPPNAELAERLVAQAAEIAAHRRALLCASVVLATTATTATVAAARRELAGSDHLPPHVTAAAIDILDALDRTIRDPEPV